MVGGLISAHLLSKKAGMDLEQGWPCEGPFLRLAVDVAKRLLPGKRSIPLRLIRAGTKSRVRFNNIYIYKYLVYLRSNAMLRLFCYLLEEPFR